MRSLTLVMRVLRSILYLSLGHALLLSPPVLSAESSLIPMIEQAIHLDSRIKAQNVKITLRGNKYIVSGTVPSLISRDLLEETVQGFAGTQYSVANVKVDPPNVSDDDIQNTIAVAVPANSLVKINGFQVQSQNGKVRLQGQTRSAYNRWIAEYFARSTRGVRSVENDIQVIGPRVSDQIIQQNVLTLIRSQFQNGDVHELKVDVENGRTTVSGVTSSPASRNRVTEVVLNVPGVTAVQNEVRLRQTFYNRYDSFK